MLGPVFRFELITTARRKRYYLARVAYGLFLLFALWQEYRGWDEIQISGDLYNTMSRFAASAFVTFAGVQGVTLLCLTPALLAGVIADEYQRKTLHYLLASPMSSALLVLGKLGARLLNLGVIVLIGVPVVCLIALFGGLDPKEVAYVYAGTFALVLFVAGLSLLVSVVASRPRQAILTAYALVAAWLFLPPLLHSIDREFEGQLAWVRPVNALVLATNPWNTWRIVSGQYNDFSYYFESRYLDPGGFWPVDFVAFLTRPDNSVMTRFIIVVGLQMLAGLAFLLLAILGLRPLRGGGGRWERRRTVWFPTLRSLSAYGRRWQRPCDDDDPMLWKERFTAGGGGLGWLSSWPIVLIVGTVFGAYLVESARPAIAEFVAGSQDDYLRIVINGTIRQATAAVFVLWLLSVASASAMSVTAEREQDAWVSLTATLLTGSEIVRAKMRGAVWSARRLTGALLVMWSVGLVTGAIYPLGVVAAGLALAVYAWFTAALGVYISLRAKNSPHALAWTLFWLLVFNVGYRVVFLGDAFPSLSVAAGAMPFVEFAVLVSYRILRSNPDDSLVNGYLGASNGEPSPGQLLMMYLISLTVYAISAALLTGAAFEAIEQVIDRPRRDGTQRAPRPK